MCPPVVMDFRGLETGIAKVHRTSDSNPQRVFAAVQHIIFYIGTSVVFNIYKPI